MLINLQKDLDKFKNPEKAKILQRFFKTGKGEYGEGDVFLGITFPFQRRVVKKYSNLSLQETQQLISSKIHEHRLVALLILVEQYKKATFDKRSEIFNFYLKNTRNINNWDLVDLSAPSIVGEYLFFVISSEARNLNKVAKEKKISHFVRDDNVNILFKLAKSENLWEKRIAIISTFAFIRKNIYDHTLKISEMLINDKHDLIHKAVGWMIREIGKRNQDAELEFLNRHYKNMPRTMLRYAIEKLDSDKKIFYMRK